MAHAKHPIALHGWNEMKNSEFLAQVVMAVTESRRIRPGSNGNYTALHNSFMGLAQAMAWQPPEKVRRHAVRIAVAAMRIAMDGCDSIEAHRKKHGLDPLAPDAIRVTEDAQ
jgi:hypothetical protein